MSMKDMSLSTQGENMKVKVMDMSLKYMSLTEYRVANPMELQYS